MSAFSEVSKTSAQIKHDFTFHRVILCCKAKQSYKKIENEKKYIKNYEKETMLSKFTTQGP